MHLPSQHSAGTPPIAAGVGLRPIHHEIVMAERPQVAWFEVHAENFMPRGLLAEDLDQIAAHYPLSLHAVGLSLGSAEGVATEHIAALKALCERYHPMLVSDHVSWSQVGDTHWPDLLPLPYTEEALDVIAANVDRVQDALGRRMLVENPSAYVRFAETDMTEAVFLAELVARTDCGLLLDVNNIHVSAANLGRNADSDLCDIIATVDPHSIYEIHLAGHAHARTPSGATVLIDDHGSEVGENVWTLFRTAIAEIGPRPTLIEWDTNIPALSVLMDEATRADAMLQRSYARLGLDAIAR